MFFITTIIQYLMRNIYVCDIIYDIIECDIASYADDSSRYSFNFSLDNVINNLEKSTGLEKIMKTNADKYNILMSSGESITVKIKDFTIISSTEKKNIRVKFNSNLFFEKYSNFLCKIVFTIALAMISHYMNFTLSTLLKK